MANRLYIYFYPEFIAHMILKDKTKLTHWFLSFVPIPVIVLLYTFRFIYLYILDRMDIMIGQNSLFYIRNQDFNKNLD